MPEGDTLRAAEAAVAPLLEGWVLTEVWFRKIRGHLLRVGDVVNRVEAIGKYLTIEVARGLVLDTHLGMSGSWRALDAAPAGAAEPWRRNPKLRVLLGTEAGYALCFAAPTIETHLVTAETSRVLRLGPDLARPEADLDEIVERTRARGSSLVLAEALLDQQIAAGVGNVYKSEALFVAGRHPFAAVAETGDAELRSLWSIAKQLLIGNVSAFGTSERATGHRRVTTARGTAGATYVYGRHRLGCRVCDNAILFSPAGDRTARSTYWCAGCQQ
ncbi:MAG: Fpg/Nei family DNA glycosylase [Actinomycetota bacterium]|nr:Fpg/Nei family DNA glycosylase [Actinomycetota bacterium]